MSAALVRWPITSRSASATTARMWATMRPVVVACRGQDQGHDLPALVLGGPAAMRAATWSTPTGVCRRVSWLLSRPRLGLRDSRLGSSIVLIQPVSRRGPAARELAAKPRLLEVGRDDPPDVGVVDGPQSFEGGHPFIRVRDDRDAPAIAKCLTQIPHAGGLAFSRGKRG